MTAIEQAFQGLFEKELLREMEELASVQTFLPGEIILDFGSYIKMMPLLISGAIKISREDLDEGELALYFLEQGDTCAMSIACAVGHKKSEIRARAEIESTLAMIPTLYMDIWMGKYTSWRAFILNNYAKRFQEMLSAVDSIAFLQMDDRILNYLTEKSLVSGLTTLNITHQQIAVDLNTSRVVVSRLLKSLEKAQKISLQRNSITLLEA